MAWDLTKGTSWGTDPFAGATNPFANVRVKGQAQVSSSQGPRPDVNFDPYGAAYGGGAGLAPGARVPGNNGKPNPGFGMGPSKGWQSWAGNPTSYRDVNLEEIAGIDPRGIFNQYYDSMKAYNQIGLASERDSANKMASLDRLLSGNQARLAGDMSGIDRNQLYAMLNMDNKLYGTNTAEIQRMKKHLLYALANRNNQRSEQKAYYGDQRGFVAEALRSALEKSQTEKGEGMRVRDDNNRNLARNATARGAFRSLGLLQDQKVQHENFNTLVDQLRQRDVDSQTQRESADRDITSALDKIRLAYEQDATNWREDNAQLDTRKGRLDIDKERGGHTFMSSIAGLNAGDAARRREEGIRNQMLAAAQQQANSRYNNAMLQGAMGAANGAFERARAADTQLRTFFGNMSNSQLRAAQQQLWDQGGSSQTNPDIKKQFNIVTEMLRGRR